MKKIFKQVNIFFKDFWVYCVFQVVFWAYIFFVATTVWGCQKFFFHSQQNQQVH